MSLQQLKNSARYQSHISSQIKFIYLFSFLCFGSDACSVFVEKVISEAAVCSVVNVVGQNSLDENMFTFEHRGSIYCTAGVQFLFSCLLFCPSCILSFTVVFYFSFLSVLSI